MNFLETICLHPCYGRNGTYGQHSMYELLSDERKAHYTLDMLILLHFILETLLNSFVTYESVHSLLRFKFEKGSYWLLLIRKLLFPKKQKFKEMATSGAKIWGRKRPTSRPQVYSRVSSCFGYIDWYLHSFKAPYRMLGAIGKYLVRICYIQLADLPLFKIVDLATFVL